MLLARLADRLVLCSSQNPVDPEHRIVHKVNAGEVVLEVFECFRNEVEGEQLSLIHI